MWEFAPALDAGSRAAISAGKPLVYVGPPAAWAARPLFASLPPAAPRPATLVLVPAVSGAVDLAAALHSLTDLGPIHPITGIARTQSLLRAGGVGTLIGTLPDALDLVGRAALRMETLARVAIGWPELLLASGLGEGLDTLLADAPAATRVVLTADETAIPDFLERHARRAPVAWAARLPTAPSGAARYAVVERSRRVRAVRAVLDALDPGSAVLWDPSPDAAPRWGELTSEPGLELLGELRPGGAPGAALAVAVDLPSAEVLTALRALGQEVVVLLDSSQVPYLRRIASPLDPLRLAGAAERAHQRLFQLRREVRERLERGLPLAELLALEPLFDDHDPALVAAALLAGRDTPPGPALPPQVRAWVRVHVNAGRRNQLRPGDLVGALLNAGGLAKDDIGRIELRESFALVDVRADQAERAVRGLTGTTLRGRRIAARLDHR